MVKGTKANIHFSIFYALFLFVRKILYLPLGVAILLAVDIYRNAALQNKKIEQFWSALRLIHTRRSGLRILQCTESTQR